MFIRIIICIISWWRNDSNVTSLKSLYLLCNSTTSAYCTDLIYYISLVRLSISNVIISLISRYVYGIHDKMLRVPNCFISYLPSRFHTIDHHRRHRHHQSVKDSVGSIVGLQGVQYTRVWRLSTLQGPRVAGALDLSTL